VRQHCRSLCSAIRIRLKRDYCIVECELSLSARLAIPEGIRRCIARRCSSLDTTDYVRQIFSERFAVCVLDQCLFSPNASAQRRPAGVGSVRVVPSKRSWSDLVATCIQFNCPHVPPGSRQYMACLHQNCNSAYVKR